MVTAADYWYFDRLLNLIGSLHYHEATQHVAVYDLGLTSWQRDHVAALCNVVYLSTPLHSLVPQWLPMHTLNLRLWAWKPLLIERALRELATSVLWLDAGIEVRAPLSDVVEALHRDGYFFVGAGHPSALFRLTHNATVAALDLQQCHNRVLAAAAATPASGVPDSGESFATQPLMLHASVIGFSVPNLDAFAEKRERRTTMAGLESLSHVAAERSVPPVSPFVQLTNHNNDDYHNNSMRSAKRKRTPLPVQRDGIVTRRRSNWSAALHCILEPAVRCALDPACIAPPGSNLTNHRYDQSVFSWLVACAADAPPTPLCAASQRFVVHTNTTYNLCAVGACAQLNYAEFGHPAQSSNAPAAHFTEASTNDKQQQDAKQASGVVFFSRRWHQPKPYLSQLCYWLPYFDPLADLDVQLVRSTLERTILDLTLLGKRCRGSPLAVLVCEFFAELCRAPDIPATEIRWLDVVTGYEQLEVDASPSVKLDRCLGTSSGKLRFRQYVRFVTSELAAAQEQHHTHNSQTSPQAAAAAEQPLHTQKSMLDSNVDADESFSLMPIQSWRSLYAWSERGANSTLSLCVPPSLSAQLRSARHATGATRTTAARDHPRSVHTLDGMALDPAAVAAANGGQLVYRVYSDLYDAQAWKELQRHNLGPFNVVLLSGNGMYSYMVDYHKLLYSRNIKYV